MMLHIVNYTMFRRLCQISMLAMVVFVISFQGVSAQENRPANPEPPTSAKADISKTAYGVKEMVVTANPQATRVGLDILQRGGNAVDAAIAVQMVLGLVEPQSSGIGGGGFALYYDAKTKMVHAFDGRETAPETAGKYLFRGKDAKPMEFYDAAIGGRAVGVPGMVRMLEMMHQKFGSIYWKDLFSPAIILSEKGFMVSPRLAALVDHDQMKLKNFSPTRLYFFPDAVTPVVAGDVLKNIPYATTLKKIASDGADGFYNGDIAQDIAKASQEDLENPGLMSIEDLKNYRAVERKAMCATYRGYGVCSVGEPSSGGLSLLIALKILEKFDMGALNAYTPQSWHLMAEASRLAFADRNEYMADPDFNKSPAELLLGDDYIAERAAQISQDKANSTITYGIPKEWKKPSVQPEPIYPKPPGTTHISIVDGQGNIVSMTSSIEDSFGSRMYVDGFMLNNQLTDFSFVPEINGKPVANRVEGGKRPRSTMTPVIVFAPDGKPKLVIGSAGGSAIMGYVLQRIISVIDWKMDIGSALAEPNIINRGNGIEMEDSADYMRGALEDKGHPVKIVDLNSGLTAIQIDPISNLLIGAADPRREGVAAGQ